MDNLPLPVPMELQLQIHQHHQMLLRQHQITFRRLSEQMPNGHPWTFLGPGGGPRLPSDVKVELQNRQLWQQFHTEGTEMIITKLGRRMFPALQLTVSGLERRARYYVLVEVAPASGRRHKYVGNGDETGTTSGRPRGWTSAGPAEPQPRIERRIYVHPDSPSTGARWMQQPISFSKLKLTNNSVDHRNNVVLTSMHKYVPRIWIIRCNDLGSIHNLNSYPASSFTFDETMFIAVTAYQNGNITKLKIDNNPFAKGFRESGQSRCKRKFQQASEVDDEEGNLSPSESESTRDPSITESPTRRPKTASSETGSSDDSGISCASPTPSLTSRNQSSTIEYEEEPQPRLHRPWIDPPSPTSTVTSSEKSTLSRSPDFLPPYYLTMLQAPFAIQQDYPKFRQYQPITYSQYL